MLGRLHALPVPRARQANGGHAGDIGGRGAALEAAQEQEFGTGRTKDGEAPARRKVGGKRDMRSLLMLVLIAALGAGGYFSRPDQAAQKANADKVLSEGRKEGGIGDLIGGIFQDANRKDSFDDMFVATKYTAKSGDKVILECWGAFTQFMCPTKPEAEKK
jgi:hypothetical protein